MQPNMKHDAVSFKVILNQYLWLRTQNEFIQHNITLINIASGVHCKTTLAYWISMDLTYSKTQNAYWETSAKVIADRLQYIRSGDDAYIYIYGQQITFGINTLAVRVLLTSIVSFRSDS